MNTLPGILRNPEWNAQRPFLLRGWVEALWCSVRLCRPLPLDQFPGLEKASSSSPGT